ncbi:glycosyltransferase family 2 protein [Sporolactobacillus putidus]|uniref:Glycosyl transferase n=1 Tax=Sporolactobacillus putidus TaxID=492735 RepID=A0A917W1D1_9BACL|nr:glycosyltransferase family 2 protein [Sporolactobacillus putidus]GGL57256.1 glycosyl transferase [Sporolactobacillus putidus]
MDRNKTSVAIIIVNWNGYKDTSECLASIGKLSYNDFKVFIVDNGSSDNSYHLLKTFITQTSLDYAVELLKSNENLGFAGGNNIAIKQALNQGFEYFWMLNNDTVVDPKALLYLVEEISKNKNIGIVGSKIYYYNSDTIWYAGGLVNKMTGFTKHIGNKQIDTGQFNNIKLVDYITGCSLLFRKELLDEIGFMMEDYFLYCEEVDWNIRASKFGWKLVYIPKSVVYHKVSKSSGGALNLSPEVTYYYIRNPFVTIKRTQNKFAVFIAFWGMLFNGVKKFLKIFIMNEEQKIKRIELILKAMKDALFVNMGMLKR